MKKITARITMMRRMLGLILFSTVRFPGGRTEGGGGCDGNGERESFSVVLSKTQSIFFSYKQKDSKRTHQKCSFGSGSPPPMKKPSIQIQIKLETEEETHKDLSFSDDVVMWGEDDSDKDRLLVFYPLTVEKKKPQSK